MNVEHRVAKFVGRLHPGQRAALAIHDQERYLSAVGRLDVNADTSGWMAPVLQRMEGGAGFLMTDARAAAEAAAWAELQRWPRGAFWCMTCWCGTVMGRDTNWRQCLCCGRVFKRLFPSIWAVDEGVAKSYTVRAGQRYGKKDRGRKR